MEKIEVCRIFPYNGYQYQKTPDYEWSPQRIIGYFYSKKKIDKNFANNEQIAISMNEYVEAFENC